MADIPVRAGQSINAAIQQASAGDVLVLEPVTFQEQVFPRSGITLRTAGALPERRIAPDDGLARIVSGSAVAPIVMLGMTGVTLIGLDFGPNVNGESDIIQVNDCNDVDVDRCRLVVPDGQQQKRFFLGNGRDIRFRRSYVSGLWREGQESQGFAAWTGGGPYLLEDCFLEVASVPFLFGGADSTSEADIPSDIRILGCHVTKSLAWKEQSRVVKNLGELKCARRVVIRGNLFEHCWADAQSGTAIMFTPVNQNASAPWSGIQDVLFEQNIIRDVVMGFTVTGYGYEYAPGSGGPTRQTTNITIRNNDIQAEQRAFFVANEVGVVSIYQNDVTLPVDSVLLSLDATVVYPDGGTERPAQWAVERFTFAENTAPNGYIHSPRALGEDALRMYAKSYSLSLEAPPPEPDPLEELRMRMEAAEAVNVAQTERLEAVLTTLRSLPANAKVHQIVQTLRSL